MEDLIVGMTYFDLNILRQIELKKDHLKWVTYSNFYREKGFKVQVSEKATKIWKYLPLVLTLLSKGQKKWGYFLESLIRGIRFILYSWLCDSKQINK